MGRWPQLSRRDLLLASLGILAGVPAARAQRPAQDFFFADPHRVLRDRLAELGSLKRRPVVGPVNLSSLYEEAARRMASPQAVDVRSFGAVLDGQADDSDALQRAVDSGAPVVRLPAHGVLRLSRTIRIRQPVSVLGEEGGAKIRPDKEAGIAFLVQDESAAADEFVRGLWFDRLDFSVEAPAFGGSAVTAVNVRDLRFTRCRVRRMSGLRVGHARQQVYRRKQPTPSADIDPAVVAGFSPDAPTDLNEDILFIDNNVDGEAYMFQSLRVDFGRRIVAAYNKGRFANISWWGGGARSLEGGGAQFLRRVQEFLIVGNEMHGSNGAFYGNNGADVLIEDNFAQDIIDTSIDFEGCIDCVARGNIAIDAGNFCYSTFYAAKNILFEDNVGVQTGKGATVVERLAAKPIGKPGGRYLFAMRSAGFSGDGKVEITCRNNLFAYTGSDGLGAVLPSYSSALTFIGNQFLNTQCNLDYRLAGSVVMEKNQFLFDRSTSGPQALVGIGGYPGRRDSRIADNTLVVEAQMAPGTVAISASKIGPGLTVIRNNEVRQRSGSADLAIAVNGVPNRFGAPTFVIADNRVPKIVDLSAPGGAEISASGNEDAQGGGVTVGKP
ncbi:right-handed parallel beta-helix repeat-containing protein [Xanthobacter pseudotagetidis]|uniref:right-handed parallel beta-helix repeat-containing protein n=1 Tax=Xanthobacter pseudotagetidis TaxID=3119911 RepID=UPI0037272ADC